MATTRQYLKPWSIVSASVVIHDMRVNFVGEIVSYPTPEKTIMVRRIPGFPGSIIEMPLTDIGHKSHARWVHYATMVARPPFFAYHAPHSFPLDMLRYDACLPVNFEVTEDCKAELTDKWGEWPTGSPLMVAKASATKEFPFAVERWQSFGWYCKELTKPERIGAECHTLPGSPCEERR